MIFIGPIVNAVVVIFAGIIGSLLKKGIPEKMSKTITQGVGMCVLVIGIRGAIKGVATSAAVNDNIEIIAVICVALGAALGELLHIDDGMNRLGNFIKEKVARLGKPKEQGQKNGDVGEAFVSATMIFCIGAWAVTGAIDSSLGSHTSLITKSVVDGITAMMLASTLGWGVSLSSIPLLVYQGGLTVLFYYLGSFLSASMIGAMGIVGSILIMMIALNLIGITKIRVANCIPAMFLPILACLILG